MRKRNLLILILSLVVLAACSSAGDFATSSQSERESFGDTSFATGGGEVAYEGSDDGFDTAADFDKSFAEELPAAPNTVPGQTQQRIVIKNGNMSIAVEAPLDTLDDISAMAVEMGGFVVSSNLDYYRLANDLEVPRANITIRVPSDRLDEAIAKIETGAGRILSKNVSGQDVTQEYTDLQSRLRNLEEAETQLQSIMDEARDTEDVLNVYNQLVGIREQIEVIKGRILFFEQSAAFSALSVEILADAAIQPITIGGWQPVGVAREAIQALIDALKGIANAAIWIVLYLIPVLVVIYIPLRLVWAVVKRLWGRRKKTSKPAVVTQKKPEETSG